MTAKLAIIKERHGEEVAFNINNISSIRKNNGVVYIHLCHDKSIATNFKSIEAAINASNTGEFETYVSN
tara:strand:+ start:1548 stop:1754 length:207 start_codon:yes stop_codon:yes gene_type:complete